MIRKSCKIALFAVIFLIFVGASRTSVSASFNAGEIVYQSAKGSTELLYGLNTPITGYSEKAVMPGAVYYFHEGNHWNAGEKAEMITAYECIIHTLKNVITLQTVKPNIFFISDNDTLEVSFGRIKLCPNESGSLGLVTSYFSYGRLPSWMCVGAELYILGLYDFTFAERFVTQTDISEWAERQAASGFPGFGDAWMAPDFIRGPEAEALREGVLYICLEFTRYLAENEFAGAAEVAGQFLNDDPTSCFNILEELWAEFVNIPNSTERENHYTYTRNFSYIFNRFQNTELIYYSPRTRSVLIDSQWQYDEAADYVGYIEDRIDYILEWLERDYDFTENGRIKIRINRDAETDNSNHYNRNTNEVYLTGDEAHNAICVATHELTHYFTFNLGYSTRNTLNVFIEGLAQLLQVEGGSEKEWHAYIDMTQMYNLLMFIRPYTDEGRSFRAYYDARMDAPNDRNEIITAEMNYLLADWGIIAQASGLMVIKNYLNPENPALIDDFPFIENINTYAKALSFTHYICENYGKEKLMGVYADIYTTEALTGKTLEEIYMDWRAYIGLE